MSNQIVKNSKINLSEKYDFACAKEVFCYAFHSQDLLDDGKTPHGKHGKKYSMKTTDYCPTCDEEIELDYSEHEIECLDCGDVFRVNADFEFTDGMWRNLSTFKRVSGRVEKMAEMREIAAEGER